MDDPSATQNELHREQAEIIAWGLDFFCIDSANAETIASMDESTDSAAPQYSLKYAPARECRSAFLFARGLRSAGCSGL
jgi:hypothetical protein